MYNKYVYIFLLIPAQNIADWNSNIYAEADLTVDFIFKWHEFNIIILNIIFAEMLWFFERGYFEQGWIKPTVTSWPTPIPKWSGDTQRENRC